jgi:succinate dehydrogenase/fumarate reductase cytochrome b subunit
LGALPLAFFLFAHLALQASAHFGAHAYETATAQLLPRAASLLASTTFVLVPLVVHAFLGVRTIVVRRPPAPAGSTMPTPPTTARATISLALARRMAAIVLALFLVGHLAHVAMLPPRDPELARETFSQLSGDLARTVAGLPLLALGYLLGVAAAVFHAASGLYAFGLRALALDAPHARQRLGLACFGWGALTFALGVHAVLVLATGVGWVAASPATAP